MGHRQGRRQTRRRKTEQANHAANPGNVAVADSGGQERMVTNNGYHWCLLRDQQISVDVCIVNQHRNPKLCRGCSNFNGDAA